MRQDYWNDTDCIWSDNLEAIELTLTHMLGHEGYHRIPQLPPPPKDIEEQRRSLKHIIVRDLWIISLFPGVAGWTTIKTSPKELLCRRGRDASRSRLSKLAVQLGRDAFHLSVYGGYEEILMEADTRGRTFISGWTNEFGPTNGEFHEQQINEQENTLQFFLLQVPKEMQAATRVDIDNEERKRKIEELEMLIDEQGERVTDPQAGLEEMDKLFKLEEQMEELLKGRPQRVDEALGQLLGGSHSYWYLRENLAYLVYTQQQQLEAQGVRLLYFQPPEQPSVGEKVQSADIEYHKDFPFGANIEPI